jgi:hypothetical protein
MANTLSWRHSTTMQQRQAMKLIDEESRERCPALHAEGYNAGKEKEEATEMR